MMMMIHIQRMLGLIIFPSGCIIIIIIMIIMIRIMMRVNYLSTFGGRVALS